MDEQDYLELSWTVAKDTPSEEEGFKGSLEDYKESLNDPENLKKAFNQAKAENYSGNDITGFAKMLGVGMETLGEGKSIGAVAGDATVAPSMQASDSMDLSSENTSLESQEEVSKEVLSEPNQKTIDTLNKEISNSIPLTITDVTTETKSLEDEFISLEKEKTRNLDINEEVEIVNLKKQTRLVGKRTKVPEIPGALKRKDKLTIEDFKGDEEKYKKYVKWRDITGGGQKISDAYNKSVTYTKQGTPIFSISEAQKKKNDEFAQSLTYNVDVKNTSTSPEAIEYFTEKYVLPKYKSEHLSQIENVEEIEKATSLAISSAINEDPVIQKLAFEIQLDALPEINKKILEVQKKYDVNSSEGNAKANEEVQEFAKSITQDVLFDNEAYKKRAKEIARVGQEAMSGINRKFKRYSDDFLRNIDTDKAIGIYPDLFYAGKESGAKGILQIMKNAKAGEISIDQIIANDYSQDIRLIQKALDEGKIKKDDVISSLVGNKTAEQALIDLKKKEKGWKKELLEDLESLSKKEDYINLFDSADLEDGDISLTDVVQTVFEAAPQIAVGAAASAGAIAATIGSGGALAPVIGSLGTATMFTTMYGQAYMDAVQAGLEEEYGDDLKDLTEDQKNKLLLEGLTSEKYGDATASAINAAIGTAMERIGAGKMVNASLKAIGLGSKAAGSLFARNFKRTAINLGRGAVKKGESGLAEFTTEFFQEANSQIGKGFQVDGISGINKYLDFSQSWEAGKPGGIVGVVLPFTGSIASQSVAEIRAGARKVAINFDLGAYSTNVKAANAFFKEAQDALDLKLKNANFYTKEQHQEDSEGLARVRNASLKIPKGVTKKQRTRILDLLVERDTLQEKIKKVNDPDLSIEDSEKLKKTREKIQTELTLVNRELDLLKVTGGVRNILSNLNDDKTVVEEFDNAEDMRKYAKKRTDSKEENLIVRASSGYGTILYNPTTKENTILINNDTSKRGAGGINVAAHEFLHFLLRKTLKNSKGTTVNLGQAITRYLDKIDPKNIDENSVFGRRLALYKDKSKKETEEEKLTLLSDALREGHVKIKQGPIRLLKNSLRRIMQQHLGQEIKFNKDEDVINFIIDYNKSIDKGKLTTAQSKLIDEKAKGKLVKRDYKTEKEQDDEIIAQESKTDKMTKASDEVQRLFDEKPRDWEVKVINEFKPITSKLVERRRGIQGFDRQLLMDEIETGKRGIYDLIQSYDPSKGVPLSAYIMTQLNNRMQEVSERNLEKYYTKDVTEERAVSSTEDGISIEESVDESITPTKQEELNLRKKIKLPDEQVEKVREAVRKTFGTKLPPPDSPQFKKALRKAFDTELFKELKTNVFKSRKDYEFFMSQNWKALYDAIPQQTLNQSFATFREPVLDENGKQKREKTPEGERIFRKKNITKEEFLDYFFSPDIGVSTRGTRKDAIVRMAAQELGFDATMETIQEPKVVEKTEFVNPGITPQSIAIPVDRAIDQKFSKSLKRTLVDEEAWNNSNEEQRINLLLQAYEDPDDVDGLQFEEFKDLPDVATSNMYVEPDTEIDQQFSKALMLSMGDLISEEIEGFTDKEIAKIVNFNNDEDGIEKVENLKSLIFALIESEEFTIEDVLNYLVPVISKAYKWTTDKKTGKPKIVNNRKIVFSGRAEFFEAIEELQSVRDQGFNQTKEGKKSDYVKGKQKVNIFGTPVVIKRIYDQSAKGVTKGEFEGDKLIARQKSARDQRDGLLKIVKFIKKFYTDDPAKNLSATAMMLQMFNANTNALVRTAAMPMFIFKQKDLSDDDYRYEHSKTAYDVIVELGKIIFNKNITSDKDINSRFNAVMDDFVVSVIPKKYDDLLNSLFKTKGSRQGYEGNVEDFNLKTEQGKRDYASALGRGRVDKPPRKSNTPYPQRYKDMAPVFAAENLDDLDLTYMETGKLVPFGESNVQIQESKSLGLDLGKIIENKTGILAKEKISAVRAAKMADENRKIDYFIAPSAEDFMGLMYKLFGKGKLGDKQKEWVNKNIMRPYAIGIEKITTARNIVTNSFQTIKKDLNITEKDLKKKIPNSVFTQEDALRVYIWAKQGLKIPGILKKEQKELVSYINGKSNLVKLANKIIKINNVDFKTPTDSWQVGNLGTDMLESLNTTRRAEYLEEWQNNVDEIFSEKNLIKLEAAFGKPYRLAVENSLQRMKTGRNRDVGRNNLVNRVVDWTNGATGAIMFFNTRSAVLQLISAGNFINFGDNNIIAAGKAFANQKQYWSDVSMLFNSEFLVNRRDGLKMSVNEADIADVAREQGVRGLINKLLKLGFTPTQVADSIAIAAGGATFYRNRYNALVKSGMNKADAEVQAMRDFRETAEESQQSSRPDKISQQQASELGRLILAFANTPSQYARIIKKAALDLKNRRGNDKENISKILYYTFAQNLIFNGLQNAMFAVAFGDVDDEDKLKKEIRVANGMADSLLRGMGIQGAILSVVKNAAIRVYQKEYKEIPMELFRLSPPISSKVRKIERASNLMSWKGDKIFEEGLTIDNPAIEITGKTIEALTNLPLDRAVKKITNLKDATDSELEFYQRLALIGGWSRWDLGIQDKKKTKVYINKSGASSSKPIGRGRSKPIK